MFDYSVKYLMMEMASAVDGQETDYFQIRRQIEKARTVAMKNFPYMQLFLQRAAEEKEPEVLEAVREVAEKLLEAYDNVYLQVDFGSMHTVSPERLVRIVDYTLNGLLTEMVREPGFRPDAYYREAILYLEELEKLCVQAGDGDGMD